MFAHRSEGDMVSEWEEPVVRDGVFDLVVRSSWQSGSSSSRLCMTKRCSDRALPAPFPPAEWSSGPLRALFATSGEFMMAIYLLLPALG